MKMFAAIWNLLDRQQRRQLILLQLLTLLMACSTVGGIAAILPFFTVLADPTAIRHSAALAQVYDYFGFSSERNFTVTLGLAFAALTLLSNAVSLSGSLLMNRFAYRTGDSLRMALFAEYLHRDYDFHCTTNSSILVSNVLNEIGRVTGGVLQSGLCVVANVVAIAFILASLVIVHPLLAAAALSLLGSSYALTYWWVRKRLLRNGALESRSVGQRLKIAKEGFTGIREILLRQAQRVIVERFSEHSRTISGTIVDTLAIAQVPKHILESITVLCLVAAALYLSGDTATAGAWLAPLSFTGLAAYRLLPALQQAFTGLVRMRADRAAFERLATDLQAARAAPPGRADSSAQSAWCKAPPQEIRFEHISYRHASERSPAVVDVSFSIQRGMMVGLIGGNGSGKTTLLDLLAGLLKPDAGNIWIDGVALGASNRRAWQASIGYIPQEIALFDATVAENITFGNEPIDPIRLRAAMRLAQLEACIAHLPAGERQMIGERGVALSGGQRQRVAIARALYRQVSLLILDEATCALDETAERALLAVLEGMRASCSCTIILAAHSISAVRRCDLIIELDRGRLVRCGTYPQLLLSSDRLRGMAATHA